MCTQHSATHIEASVACVGDRTGHVVGRGSLAVIPHGCSASGVQMLWKTFVHGGVIHQKQIPLKPTQGEGHNVTEVDDTIGQSVIKNKISL